MSTSSDSPSASDDHAADESRRQSSEGSPSGDGSADFARRSRVSSASYVASEEEGGTSRDPGFNLRRPTELKKRRAERSPGLRSRKKILKEYSEGYRELFNSSLAEFRQGTGFVAHAPMTPSYPDGQHGIVKWTTQEKELFFDALARLGKGNIRGIAAHIGTKSAIEVQEYTQRLHGAFAQRHLHDRMVAPRFARFADFPAAYEISGECDSALEDAADALLLHQEEYECLTEKQLHGDYWLVDNSVAQWTHAQIAKGDEGASEVTKVLPEATLLNPREWLSVSENVFMNPGAPKLESNWQFLAFEKETPSINHTAFSDFHTLTISITRRIVQTALFCAESRIKATSNKYHPRDKNVKNQDVAAALDILRMKHSKFDYWVDVPRRNNLEVQDKARKETRTGRPMSFEEVEMKLKEPVRRTRRKKGDDDEKPTDTGDSPLGPDSSQANEFGGSQNPKSTPRFSSQAQTSIVSPSPSPPPSPSTIHAVLQDERASRLHELYLWTDVLQETPPVQLELSASLPEATIEPAGRKSRDELEDIGWRDRIRGVGSAWEAMQNVISEEEFEETGRMARLNRERRQMEGRDMEDEEAESEGVIENLEGSDEEEEVEDVDMDGPEHGFDGGGSGNSDVEENGTDDRTDDGTDGTSSIVDSAYLPRKGEFGRPSH
jgi:RNA polymerase I-specific transcription initiation factor RRN5